jgi:glycosyltransferase involved in cell wall biosynthesis
MKRAIITGWTGTLFAKIASHTLPLIENYANRHGAAFACGNLHGERPPSWNKVPLIIQALQQVDEVAWIDCDVVIERSEKSIFEEMKDGSLHGVVEHETECGTVPNCGIWVVRKEMVPVLTEIWNSGENIHHPWWEQSCVISRMGYLVNNTHASLGEPTDLYHKTSWLGPEWNHHPSDKRKVEKPNFRHITMYDDRLGVTKKYAALAERLLEEEKENKIISGISRVAQADTMTSRPSPKSTTSSSMRVLVQSRRNLFNSKGGDTIALTRTSEALQKLGVDVVIDPMGRENPKEFDLVHLYNFATPEEIEPRARKAKELDVPFVVTTLHEDLDNYFPKMIIYGETLTKHFGGEYSHVPYDILHKAIKEAITKNPNTLIRDNSFTAKHAEVLLSSGNQESILLKNEYPHTRRIEVVPFGSEGLPDVGKDLFYKKHGFSDYILCVGRIEWRKNQAMLLKALEESDLPVVLVAGNMTYQPAYQEAMTKCKRKGRTLIVANLSKEELASAYKGALAHVLPSWFELPGLVTLEAARCGTPVVGTTMGTLSDYLGREATYCDPESIQSIHSAIEVAIEKPQNNPRLVERASQYTWENTGKKLISIFESVLSGYKPERKEKEMESNSENMTSYHEQISPT